LKGLEHWDSEFESHSTHGCKFAFSCVVPSYVGRGFMMGLSPVQVRKVEDKVVPVLLFN